MHLEVLVEGQADRIALNSILTKILGPHGSPHTWAIHTHQGVGEFPIDPAGKPRPRDRTLLHNLPASLRAYGRSLLPDQAVIVLVDLDQRDCKAFKKRLVDLLQHCDPKPMTLFRIAIEELEAWFLGDENALVSAYPSADRAILGSYVQDSICGTWEVIADAVYPGGLRALKSGGRWAPLHEKCLWAKKIAPLMDVDSNLSRSFCVFRDGVRRLVAQGQGPTA